jgi:hypothetical protein
MSYSSSDDWFGFATRDDFMDWAVGQFKEHAGVVVTDKSAMIYDEETEQDGCCEICYTENVRVEVQYECAVLKYKGYYSYNGDDLSFTADYDPWDVDVPEYS